MKRGADGLFGFSVSSRANCEIDKITKGSSAQASGLQVGDKIYAINDKPVFSTTEIEEMMKNTGHSVSLRLYKAGTSLRNNNSVEIAISLKGEIKYMKPYVF